MANKGILVDTGPLVAILNDRDQHHAACLASSKTIQGPFYTSWPVVTEAAYLLRDRHDAVEKLLGVVRNSELRLLELGPADVDGITRILANYADQQLDLADATLMYLAEREGIDRVFTVDQRHFSLFRTAAGKSLILLPGPARRNALASLATL